MAIAADALGYSASRVSKDAETRFTDEFALVAAPGLKFQVQSSKWRPDSGDEGTCDLSLILTLPPALAVDFGGAAVLSGNVQLRLRKAENEWTISRHGIPISDFRVYFGPFVYTNAKQRVADINRMKYEQRREAALAREQAAAQAEAAYKRDHPREWAAEQERLRLEGEKRRKELDAREADERRKAAACEANGGTWGYKRHPHSKIRLTENQCYFRTSE